LIPRDRSHGCTPAATGRRPAWCIRRGFPLGRPGPLGARAKPAQGASGGRESWLAGREWGSGL